MTSNKNIVICDIDGTVANNDHRQHLLKGFKTWDKFFAHLSEDLPISEVIEFVINLHNEGRDIVFVTGRPARYEEATRKWLGKYFDFEIKLFMRQDKDKRNKVEVKKEIFLENFNSEDIFLVIDNDRDLIKMWQSLSLNTKLVS